MTTTTISGGGGRRASASSPSRIARRECGRSFGITTTPMRWRSQAGLRRRRRHQQRGGEGRNDVGTTRHPILEAANHAPRLSSPLMPRKPRHHRCRRRRDRGRRRRKLTYEMEENAARREDDEDDEGRSEDSGGPICRPGQKTGGSVGRPRVLRRATATMAAAGVERPGRRRRSCRRRPTTDCRLGEIGGANLNHRRRREQRGRRRGGRGGGKSYTVM
jgi:hypothetical protein